MTAGPVPHAEGGAPDDQSEVVAFLSRPDIHPGRGSVTVIQTHGALVFLAGDVALKIKRAVRYDYMDLSTLELRERMIRRELELNRPSAPKIYRDVISVTREADGTLALGGAGEPVEWVLVMWRFPAGDELTSVAARGALDDRMAAELGANIFAYHQAAPRREADGAGLMGAIVEELEHAFAGMHDALGADRVRAYLAAARAAHGRVSPLLTRRGAEGHIRRCHGDLHLRNLVLIDGHPVPYDALEFDEVLGTCDVLYDLAFLVMDLRHRGLHGAANITLNAYLLRALGAEDSGLAALPLFLAIRAAIRAMVQVQTDRATGHPGQTGGDARGYLEDAVAVLAPRQPRLIAVGGYSGTGKTTLAHALAHRIGAAPGAVHLRSDLERKAREGVAAATALSDAHYSRAARDEVYRAMLGRAGVILAAGHSVLVDATFLDPAQRDAVEQVALGAGVPFTGLWLAAPPEVLIARVSARAGDASDADANVVRAQLRQACGAMSWTGIDAGGEMSATVAAAIAAIGVCDD